MRSNECESETEDVEADISAEEDREKCIFATSTKDDNLK